jgi:uncharacterized protein with HEPN domain
MTKDWRAHALHIIGASEKIKRICARGDFLADEILFDALLRNLQTLSEAVGLLPEALKEKFEEIPWREISGFRNILVHNYLGEIDRTTIQSILNNDLDPLLARVKEMLRAE